MTQPAAPTAPAPTTSAPRRSRLAPLAAVLAGLGIALAGLTWFSYVNSARAEGGGTASYVLAAGSGHGDGQWHWLHPDGSVGDPIGDDAALVPGDRLGFVDTDGKLTDYTFDLATEEGNETQGQQFSVDANGDIFRLEPAAGGTLEFERGTGWIWVGVGSALAFGGAGFAFVVARHERDESVDAATEEL